MKKYCFDTSGFSNPWLEWTDDVVPSLWDQVMDRIKNGSIGVTAEIYEELTYIPGRLGSCIIHEKARLLMELKDESWNWKSYVDHGIRMLEEHKDFIAEYTDMKTDDTVCLNDMTIIALAKTLQIPLVSMESSAYPSPKKKRIPDICDLEDIKHYKFVDFLKAENIKA